MDPTYENAQRRREALRRELEEIDLFLRLHQKFSTGTEPERVDAGDTAPVVAAPDATTPKTQYVERKRNLPAPRMALVVREMLLERRQPMTRTDIVEALELKGIPVAGQDKSKAIGTIMWRLRHQFANIPGFGYWPIDLPFKGAGGEYIPDTTTRPQASGTDADGDMFDQTGKPQ